MFCDIIRRINTAGSVSTSESGTGNGVRIYGKSVFKNAASFRG